MKKKFFANPNSDRKSQIDTNILLIIFMAEKVWGIKIYTKTTYEKMNGKYIPKMLGVIEAPVTKMMKAYPSEFSFMRHQTKRDKK